MRLSTRHLWVLAGTIFVVAVIVVANSSYHPAPAPPPQPTPEQKATQAKQQTAQPAVGKAIRKAGLCETPPFGMDTRKYEDLAALLGEENLHDVLHNICRAKYLHDPKWRGHLHRIGFSDEFIDGNDVGYIALRVLEEFKRCMDANHGGAAGC